MRSKKRIKSFLRWLEKEWEASPDLRFGQLLINLGIVTDDIRTWNAEVIDYPLPHEVMREIQTWGTKQKYKNHKDEFIGVVRKDIFIKDLDTDHIKAILKTQTHIQDTNLEKILKQELKFRKKKLKEETKNRRKRKV